jgi:hypothetical protein
MVAENLKCGVMAKREFLVAAGVRRRLLNALGILHVRSVVGNPIPIV